MIGSLYSGISGINANTNAMSVIGDNIANMSTTGFKSSDISFANVLSQSLGGSDGSQIGRGVMMSDIRPQWSSGILESTANVTDLAVNGTGLFVVQGADGGRFYTRAGDFKFDKDARLVNPEGFVVQGYEIDETGALGKISGISVSNTGNAPKATTEMNVGINLDAGAIQGDTYSTTLTVYDSLGNAIGLTLDFSKTETDGEWAVEAEIPSSVGVAGLDITTVTFDERGVLASGLDPEVQLVLANGAENFEIGWDVYGSGAGGGTLTGYASGSATLSQSQDGYPAGALQGVSVSEAGEIVASYSNGQLVPLYKVALADFRNYSGLRKMGGNLFAESMGSGQANVGIAGEGGMGSISSNSLEMSNVDLAKEFVKMITTQRSFQANSRVITTSDEVLTELINLKR
jgi:flagellar hook protein FlgE